MPGEGHCQRLHSCSRCLQSSGCQPRCSHCCSLLHFAADCCMMLAAACSCCLQLLFAVAACSCCSQFAAACSLMLLSVCCCLQFAAACSSLQFAVRCCPQSPAPQSIACHLARTSRSSLLAQTIEQCHPRCSQLVAIASSRAWLSLLAPVPTLLAVRCGMKD